MKKTPYAIGLITLSFVAAMASTGAILPAAVAPPLNASATATADIEGPDSVASGMVVRLKVGKKAKGDEFNWVLMHHTVAGLARGDVPIYPENKGQTLYLGSTLDGTYTILQIASGVTKDGKATTSTQVKVVVIGKRPPGPNPPPGPGPNPPPGPTPIPDGKYKIAQKSYDLAQALDAAKKAKSKEVANNFDSIAAAMAAGAINTINASRAELVKLNRVTLTGDESIALTPTDPWYKWFYEIGLFADKFGVKSVQDQAQVYREIAIGLNAVK